MRYAFVALSVICCLVLSRPAAANDRIAVLYVSHMADIQHAQRNVLPELATMLKQLRAEYPRLLFIHGGNALGPSSLSSFDKGVHMVALLNMLEPDVMAAGRRDFMYKEDELTLRSREATFPIACSNVMDPLTGKQPAGLVRTEMLDDRDVTFGFLALVAPEMETSYAQERALVLGGFELMGSISHELRRYGAEFIIASADFLPDEQDMMLSQYGVDLLFLSDGNKDSIETVDGQIRVYYGNREGAALLEFEPDAQTGRLQLAASRFLPFADYEQDGELVAAISKYSESLDSLLSVPVGVIATDAHTHRHGLRTEENAFASLVADAMREYYGTDIAVLNAGGLRGNADYTAGTMLTRGNLQAEMPLHDTICTSLMRGRDVWSALEYGVSTVETVKGRFLHVSGLQYSYNPAAPAGARIRAVTVGGVPLDPDKEYSVSAPSYLVTHGDRFIMFPGRCESGAGRQPQDLVELVREHITRHAPVAPIVEGRITTTAD